MYGGFQNAILDPLLDRRGVNELRRRGRVAMARLATALLAGTMLFSLAGGALAKGKTVGVSWANFQEERWKIDEAAMKAAIAAAGDKYVAADAQSSAQKQL